MLFRCNGTDMCYARITPLKRLLCYAVAIEDNIVVSFCSGKLYRSSLWAIIWVCLQFIDKFQAVY